MQNTRPNYNFELPLKNGGTANCTLKQPKVGLRNQVSDLVIDSQMLLEESNAYYNMTGPINKRIVAAEYAQDMEAATKARAELAVVRGEIDRLRNEQDLYAIEQVRLCTNIPNAADGTTRSVDDVDFDDVDSNVVQDAVHFFRFGQSR